MNRGLGTVAGRRTGLTLLLPLVRGAGLAAAMLLLLGGAAAGQRGIVRLGLRVEQGVRVGQPAPQFQLPYATKSGAGPADQPFDLSKELGHVVVLGFFERDADSAAVAGWKYFAAHADSLFGGEVVVAGVSRDSLSTHVAFATTLSLPFKFLADPSAEVSRNYGLRGDALRRGMLLVVGRDGVVRYVRRPFGVLNPQDLRALMTAIRAARER